MTCSTRGPNVSSVAANASAPVFANLPRGAPGAADAIPESLASLCGRLAEYGFRPREGPPEHAHAIHQQGAVTGRMDVALDHRAVRAQLAPTGDLQRGGERRHALVESFQGGGLDQTGPTDQGRVVRHWLEIHPAETPQD